jgi:hypothetical protein
VVFVGSSLSGGVTGFKLNSDGTLTQIPGDGTTGNFSPSAIAESGSSLIAVQQQGTGVQANLYAMNGQTGALALKGTTQIPAQPLDALGTLSAAMNDEFAYIGTVDGIYAFSISNGNLMPVPGSPFQTGSPADEFQLSAYSFLAINGNFLMAAHGANSAVQSLQIGSNGALTPKGNSQSSGSFMGMAIGPSGDKIFASFSGTGSFGTLVESRAANPSQGNFEGRIAVNPSGRFLYQAYDKQPIINIYSVDQQSVKLTLSRQASAEDAGTGIAIDPTGRFLVGIFGDDIGEHLLVYSVNAATGALTRIPGSYPVGSTTRPTDILIANF